MAEIAVIDSLDDIRPQVENTNLHTERGRQALNRSISNDGVIGAITVAADGEVFDGSATTETLAELGLVNPIVVRSRGDRPIIHIREDIPNASDPRAKRLGVAANRVAQLDYNPNTELLAEYRADNLLEGLYTSPEVDRLLVAASQPDVPEATEQKQPQLVSTRFIEIYCSDADLEYYRPVLAEWSNRKGTTVNIS